MEKYSSNMGLDGEKMEVGGEMNINKVLENIKNPELEKAPSVSLSEMAKKEFSSIAKDIKNQKNNLFLVIRCWNKTENELRDLFERLKRMHTNIPELQGVFISINAGGDKDAQTSKAVDSLIGSETLPFKVVSTQVNEYSWTAGLNAPVALLHSVCKESKTDEANQFVLNYSFDSIMSDEANQEISDHIQSGEPLMTARVEDKIDSKEDLEMIREENLENFSGMVSEYYKVLTDKKIFFSAEKFMDDNHMGMVTLGRNTNMLFSIKDVVGLGGFDRSCNPMGGMEDHDFVFRLFLDTVKRLENETDPILQEKLSDKVRAYNQAFINPLPYNDLAWNRMSQGEKAVDDKKATGRVFKYDHERKALQKIGSRLAEKFKTGGEDFAVPTSEQDFKIV